MSDLAIRTAGLGKRYLLGGRQELYGTLRDTLMEAARGALRRLAPAHRPRPVGDAEEIWALRDVSLEIRAGEVVGIVGRNGAGKSTLLKVLARITTPTTGRAEIHGRVGSLLEVGTGFHAELTGRENILLNGAILGMRRAEIARKFDQIVAFSEVEKFIDTPVKHYSSGMYLRLAFAVAAHLETEILLVDEVLAVGDTAFQRRCLGKMQDVGAQGRTVLFVSHNMVAVEQLCTRGVVLENGHSRYFGAARDAISHYDRSLRETATTGRASPDGSSDGTVQIVACDVLNQVFERDPPPGPFEDVVLRVHLLVNDRIRRPAFGLEIRSRSGLVLLSLNSVELGRQMPALEPGPATIHITVKDIRYVPGLYRADVWVMSSPQPVHARLDAVDFEIRQKPLYGTRALDSRYGWVVAEVEFSAGSAATEFPVVKPAGLEEADV